MVNLVRGWTGSWSGDSSLTTAPSSADGAIVGADLGVLEGLTGQNFVLMRSVIPRNGSKWLARRCDGCRLTNSTTKKLSLPFQASSQSMVITVDCQSGWKVDQVIASNAILRRLGTSSPVRRFITAMAVAEKIYRLTLNDAYRTVWKMRDRLLLNGAIWFASEARGHRALNDLSSFDSIWKTAAFLRLPPHNALQPLNGM